MKYFKKFVLVLVVAIMTTAMIGCGNKAQQSSEISTETAEAQLQPEGMDKERIQGEGYTIVALEGWHELTEVVVPGYLGLKDDDNSYINNANRTRPRICRRKAFGRRGKTTVCRW